MSSTLQSVSAFLTETTSLAFLLPDGHSRGQIRGLFLRQLWHLKPMRCLIFSAVRSKASPWNQTAIATTKSNQLDRNLRLKEKTICILHWSGKLSLSIKTLRLGVTSPNSSRVNGTPFTDNDVTYYRGIMYKLKSFTEVTLTIQVLTVLRNEFSQQQNQGG